MEAERIYLDARRRQSEITEEEALDGSWGIAGSNGGARAAILLLGVMRKLMEKDFFRRIDYLSAVEGSGLMAACFTSLVTGKKSTTGKFGSQAHNTPFCPSTNTTADKENLKVTPDQQIAHLKSNILNLNPHFWKNLSKGRGLFGIGLSGFSYGLAIFSFILFSWMALHHAYLYWVSDGQFQDMLQTYRGNPILWSHGVLFELSEVKRTLLSFQGCLSTGLAAGAGFIFSLIFFLFYLRPSLSDQVSDILIEVKVKEYYYLGFIFTYISLFTMGWFVQPDNYWLVFVMPIGLMFGVMVSSMLGSFITRQMAVEDENRRALVAEISTAGFLMLLAALAFPLLLITLLLAGGWITLICSMICFLIGAQITFSRIKKLSVVRAMRWRGNSWPNLFLGLFVALLFATTGKLLLHLAGIYGGEYSYLWYVLGFIIPGLLLLGFKLVVRKTQYNSLHNHFKNRKSKIYLSTVSRKKDKLRDDTDLLLHQISNTAHGPYLILNAALNVHSSADSSTRKKKARPFVFTKYFVGSDKTGYTKTKAYQGGEVTLADAMMCSAATYHSGMGVHGFYAQAFLFTLLNLRLGSWLPNPWYDRAEEVRHSRGKSRFTNFIREFMNRFSTRALAVNISSGMHTGDYWGLTPLFERHCENIILCDFRSPTDLIPGELDFTPIRAIAAQYNVRLIDLKTEDLRPDNADDSDLCEKNVLTCKLSYQDGTTGRLYYLKSSLSKALPDSILEYHDSHASFPSRFNSDSKQPDLQFNSFVELGESLSEQFLELRHKAELADFDDLIGERIGQIDEEVEKNEAQQKELEEFKTLLAERIAQIDQEIKTDAIAYDGLHKEEETLVKKLTRFREEKVLVSDIEKKFELEQRIQNMEEELVKLRDKISQTQKGLPIVKFGTLQRLIDNILLLIQRNLLNKNKMAADREILVKKRTYIEDVLAKQLVQMNEAEVEAEIKAVQKILDDVEQKLEEAGINTYNISIADIRRVLLKLLTIN